MPGTPSQRPSNEGGRLPCCKHSSSGCNHTSEPRREEERNFLVNPQDYKKYPVICVLSH